MSETLNIRADESGLNGQQVNIYTNFHKVQHPGFPFDESRRKWQKFESTVKTYPFTKQVEGGSLVKCREVKQVRGLNQNRWLTLSQNESEQSYYENKLHFETRYAYQPIEQPKEEKKEMENSTSLIESCRNSLQGWKDELKRNGESLGQVNEHSYTTGYMSGYFEGRSKT